ncbi:hypothetical protein HG530_001749 [Fusarium avenaceum]|nr:hypothetical protein HG530_001749 [Fusarium avenaceum]
MALLKDAKEAAQAFHIPTATALPTHPLRQLARRVANDITSGTLTVTVSPDRTCGFDGDGQPWTCEGQASCTWESGVVNSFWCGWSHLFTTCYDSTAFTDSSSCDNDCRSNERNGYCGISTRPYCMEFELGNGIKSRGCNAVPSSQQLLASTLYNKPREFKTQVFVNGLQQTEWVSDLKPTMTDSATEEPSSASSSSASSSSVVPNPKPGPNIGAIVGGAVGGLAVLILIGVVGFLLLRRRKSKAASQHELNTGFSPQPYTPGPLDKAQWSPTQARPCMDLPSPGYAPATSPTLYEGLGPGTAWSAELDGRKADHHRGTMQEM